MKGVQILGMKGVWFTMESAIACIIIGIFLLTVTGGYIVDSRPVDVSAITFDSLHGLDDRGILRGYATSLDYDGLNSEILIAGYNHSVNICDSVGTCTGPTASGNQVWVGSYFIAGDSNYHPLEVKLFVWEEES